MTIGSLFTGIAGLELGLELCGLGPVLWQCDSDPAARAVLAAHWPGVKCYHDVRDIIDGRQYVAPVRLVCGGFPCQPVSVAGKRLAQKDARWLWPFFAAVVARLRPRLVFIENVPGLRSAGLRDVLADLAALGFDAEWDVFSAAEVGAPHIRRRLFLLAHAVGVELRHQPRRGGGASRARAPELATDGGSGALANPDRERFSRGTDEQEAALSPGRPLAQGDHPWAVEPDIRRVAHGVPARVDRLRLLGNACVPQQAARAFEVLSARARASREAHGVTAEE